eukprot:3587012-Pleurochrysis_carterae.AAC.1
MNDRLACTRQADTELGGLPQSTVTDTGMHFMLRIAVRDIAPIDPQLDRQLLSCGLSVSTCFPSSRRVLQETYGAEGYFSPPALQGKCALALQAVRLVPLLGPKYLPSPAASRVPKRSSRSGGPR